MSSLTDAERGAANMVGNLMVLPYMIRPLKSCFAEFLKERAFTNIADADSLFYKNPLELFADDFKEVYVRSIAPGTPIGIKDIEDSVVQYRYLVLHEFVRDCEMLVTNAKTFNANTPATIALAEELRVKCYQVVLKVLRLVAADGRLDKLIVIDNYTLKAHMVIGRGDFIKKPPRQLCGIRVYEAFYHSLFEWAALNKREEIFAFYVIDLLGMTEPQVSNRVTANNELFLRPYDDLDHDQFIKFWHMVADTSHTAMHNQFVEERAIRSGPHVNGFVHFVEVAVNNFMPQEKPQFTHLPPDASDRGKRPAKKPASQKRPVKRPVVKRFM